MKKLFVLLGILAITPVWVMAQVAGDTISGQNGQPTTKIEKADLIQSHPELREMNAYFDRLTTFLRYVKTLDEETQQKVLAFKKEIKGLLKN